MLVWVWATAFAAVPLHGAVGPLAEDLEAGLISEPDALFVRYQQMFEPEEVDPRYALEIAEDTWVCGTGLVQDLRRDWLNLSNEQQVHIAARLQEPWAVPGVAAAIDPTIAPFPLTRSDPPASPPRNPPAAPTSPCWSSENRSVHKTEHFSVEWTTGFDRSRAESFGRALERGYDVQIADGWRVPDGMSGYLVQVTVSTDNYAGAYTTIGQCGGFYMPYIVAGRGSFSAGRWFEDMAAHEFNHAIQFGYGFAHQFWFWESTATYVQESVNPTHNEWSPYIEGYTDNPQISMHASSQQNQNVFGHMYGMAIWNFYLDEHVGGPELNRALWSDALRVDGEGTFWMDDALAGQGHDFREVYEGFILNNTVMDFAESAAFGEVDTVARVGALPAAGAEGQPGPSGRGQDYIRFDPGLTNEATPDLLVRFNGVAEGDWSVFLVGVNGTELTQVARFEIVDGYGEARLNDAAQFERAWLVVSPFNRDERTFAYNWNAEAAVALREGPLAACGCQSTPSRGGALGLALLPLLALRRRTRAA